MFSDHQEEGLKANDKLIICKFVNVLKIKWDIPKEPIIQKASHKGSYKILRGEWKWKDIIAGHQIQQKYASLSIFLQWKTDIHLQEKYAYRHIHIYVFLQINK